VKDGLIFDVGMHNGDDTAFYLHQRYKVVAVEANPEMVRAAAVRFAEQIASGQLTLLNVAIAESSGRKTFWISDEHSDWSSFDKAIASREGRRCHSVEVETVRFRDILEKFGIPLYLKIDIEGNDHLCLRDLTAQTRPQYISVESCCTGEDTPLGLEQSLMNLERLRVLGYRKFKLIDQTTFRAFHAHDRSWELWERLGNMATSYQSRKARLARVLGLQHFAIPAKLKLERRHGWQFQVGSSGPWGDGTLGRWLDYPEASKMFVNLRRRHIANAHNPNLWWDWHATI